MSLSFFYAAADKQAEGQGKPVNMALTEMLAQTQVHDTVNVKLPIRKKDFKAYFEDHARDT